MKKYIFLILLLYACRIYSQVSADFSTNGLHNFSTVPNGITFVETNPVQPHERSYQLVFEDDFDGTSLNTSNWYTYSPDDGRSGEVFLQYYTDDNVTVSGGYLRLQTKIDPGTKNITDFPENNANPWMAPDNRYFKYTSGEVISKAKYKAGKIEIRCQIPYIDGTWPAFWLFGDCEQEIDGFEFNNSESNDPYYAGRDVLMTYHGNMSCHDHNTHLQSETVYQTSASLYSEFHTYAIDWDETKIIWTLDGNIIRQVYKYWTFSGTPTPLTTPGAIASYPNPLEFTPFLTEEIGMRLILNTGIAHDQGSYPQWFLIDYVKIYEKSDCYSDRVVCVNDIPAPGIIAAKTVTTNTPCSFAVTSGGQSIEMKGIESVTLQTGFSAEMGSSFYAHLSTCDNYEVLRTSDQATKGNVGAENLSADQAIEVKQTSSISVYPSPNEGIFTLEAVNSEPKDVYVYDLLGKVIYERKNDNQRSLVIDISKLPKGIYTVKVISNGVTSTKKVITQ